MPQHNKPDITQQISFIKDAIDIVSRGNTIVMDAKHATKKREGYTREQALELIVKTIQQIAVSSRGIAELKEVSNG